MVRKREPFSSMGTKSSHPTACQTRAKSTSIPVFFEKVQIEASGMTKASILDHGVSLTLAIILQIEVRCIIFIYFHVLGLWFFSLLLELFFLFIFLIVHCCWCWCRFGGMTGA